MKEGASVLGAELTESVAVSPLESDVYVSFIIPIEFPHLLPVKFGGGASAIHSAL